MILLIGRQHKSLAAVGVKVAVGGVGPQPGQRGAKVALFVRRLRLTRAAI